MNDNSRLQGDKKPGFEKKHGNLPPSHREHPRNKKKNPGGRTTVPPDSSSDSDGHQPTRGAGFHPFGVRPHEYYLREDRW